MQIWVEKNCTLIANAKSLYFFLSFVYHHSIGILFLDEHMET